MQGQGKFSLQNYEAPGPVGAAFIESQGPIDIIGGPAGSGKTVASGFKGPFLAGNWAPVCKDGVIRVKQATIRSTYRDLARTCLSSWHEMFPEKHPFTVDYKGGLDRPVTHKLAWATIREGRQVKVEYTHEFGAIGDANVEQFIKGYELTFGWMNECDLLDERVPGLFLSRTGRYPRMELIAESELARVVAPYRKRMQALGVNISDDETLLPRLIWGDCNPPDVGNWVVRQGGWVEKDHADRNPMINLYVQPGGLSPKAENRKGKPRSSYELEAATMKNKQDVKRYVHGEPGFTAEGKPVYEDEFSLQLHVSDEWLKPVQGLPLTLGFDAGGSPACTIGQFMPNGQNRVLREIVTDPGTGAARFSAMVLEVLISDYRGFPVSEAWGDPSAFYGADRANGELAWMETVARALNINVSPAPSNEPGLRHDAVRWYLGGLIDGKTPRYIVDPRCKRLIAGFVAHYHLTKQATGGNTDRLAVAKNEYSHVHDAEQYRCLGHRGRAGVIGDVSGMGRAPNVASLQAARAKSQPKTSFSVWDV
ncbi:MAG: hypothetical protein KF723_22985 [Rhizobiaceae bacterium]|nr:hypothetical protein [Rhizobiaceae bacterium]